MSDKNTTAMEFINHVVGKQVFGGRSGTEDEMSFRGNHDRMCWCISNFGGKALPNEPHEFNKSCATIWRFEDGSAVFLSSDPTVIENTPSIQIQLIELCNYTEDQLPPYSGNLGSSGDIAFVAGMGVNLIGHFENGEYHQPSTDQQSNQPKYSDECQASFGAYVRSRYQQSTPVELAGDHQKASEYLTDRNESMAELMKSLKWEYSDPATIKAEVHGCTVYHSLVYDTHWGKLKAPAGFTDTQNGPLFFKSCVCFMAYVLAKVW